MKAVLMLVETSLYEDTFVLYKKVLKAGVHALLKYA